MSEILDNCGCCEGIQNLTPQSLENQPGLTALVYRAGTHGTFKDTMLADLSRQPALADLGTRDDDDPAIALLDGWATVLDVLTFYQERIANEGYLRTATERRSLVELARLIGYQPRPGVAASTVLAFRMQDAPGVPRQATIPSGAKAQSIPAAGELPQFFETIETIEARTEWNQLRPRQYQPQLLDISSGALRWQQTDGGISADPHGASVYASALYLSGPAAVKQGDLLLIAPDDTATNRSSTPSLCLTARKVTYEAQLDRTRVDLESSATPGSLTFPALPSLSIDPGQRPPFTTNYPGFQPLALTQENIEYYILGAAWRERDLHSFIVFNNWNPDDVLAYINRDPAPGTVFGSENVFAFKEKVGFFGHNAPLYSTLPKDQANNPLFAPNWDGQKWQIWWDPGQTQPTPWIDNYGVDVFLERNLPAVVRKSWAVFAHLEATGDTTLTPYWIDAVRESSLAAFALSGKATGLLLDAPDKTAAFAVRRTTAYVQGEAQPLALLPLDDVVAGKTIMLDRMVFGLVPGQRLVLQGELSDAPGVINTEILSLSEIVHYGGFTTLNLAAAPLKSYKRSTVTLNANVAAATHGESKSEVLGSGDTSQPFQTFSLKQKPLTYTADVSPSGAASTLQVRVNDVLWDEAPSLYTLGPRDRAYVTRHDDDGTVRVEFGDGIHGARPPTGAENVTAAYRVGIGEAGLLKPTQISLLVTRPIGVQDVTNPLAPIGGQDPERLEDARRNAPLVVQTLDRIVSLVDFENFARAFAGIAKARARWLWDGETRVVHLTIAGARGTTIDPSDILYQKLSQAIDAAREPSQPVRIESYQPMYFYLEATIQVNARYLADKVLAAVRDTLLTKYSFDNQDLGRPVSASEVIVAMQGVAGVDAVDLGSFHLVDTQFGAQSGPRSEILVPDDGTFKPAQLLLLHLDGLKLAEMFQP